MKKIKLLFVCSANICRSPTAEGVVRAHVKNAGLNPKVELDSAGTLRSRVGEAPDVRAQKAALRRGYDLSRIRARRVIDADFVGFDRILAMDRDNLAILERDCPPNIDTSWVCCLSIRRDLPNAKCPIPTTATTRASSVCWTF